MSKSKKFLIYVIELLIGGLIMLIDIRLFLLYFFFCIMWAFDKNIDYLRKLIRVFQIANEGKLMSIIKKLNITDAELEEIGNQVENNLTDEQRKSVYKDMSDLGLK